MISVIFNHLEFVISVLLAIIGIIVTIYLYCIERKFRQISYTYQTTSILSTNAFVDKLSFVYNGKPLDSLYITDLIIWSSGKKIIDHNDIAPACPLTIHAPSEILNYQVLHTNEKFNNFQITEINNTLSIDFDYIGKNNGIAIRIIHSDNSEKFSVTCKIKDGRETLYSGHRKGYFYTIFNSKFIKYVLSRKITSFIFIVFTMFLFPIAFIQSANYADNNFFGLPNTNIFMNLDSIVISVLCICSFLLSIPHIFNLFKIEPPDDLLNHTFCER